MKVQNYHCYIPNDSVFFPLFLNQALQQFICRFLLQGILVYNYLFYRRYYYKQHGRCKTAANAMVYLNTKIDNFSSDIDNSSDGFEMSSGEISPPK